MNRVSSVCLLLFFVSLSLSAQQRVRHYYTVERFDERSIREELQRRPCDPIEGIYQENGGERLAILRFESSDFPGGTHYRAVVLQSSREQSFFQPGFVRAFLEKGVSEEGYNITYYYLDSRRLLYKTDRMAVFDGVLLSIPRYPGYSRYRQESVVFHKLFPGASEGASVAPADASVAKLPVSSDGLETARRLYRSGVYGEAYELLGRIVATNPRQADGWQLRGVIACFYRNDPAAGYRDLTVARQLRPESDTLWYYSACASYALDSLQRASTEAGHCLLLAPGYAEARFLRAHIRAEQGDATGALSDYDYLSVTRLPACCPRAVLLNEQANLLSQSGRYDAAEEKISEALELAPNDALLLETRGEIAFRRGDYRSSVAWLTRSLERCPSQRAYRMRSAAYVKLGARRKAEADRREAEACMAETPDCMELKTEYPLFSEI